MKASHRDGSKILEESHRDRKPIQASPRDLRGRMMQRQVESPLKHLEEALREEEQQPSHPSQLPSQASTGDTWDDTGSPPSRTGPAREGAWLVQRPVNYVLDILPSALGRRVIPVYKRWGEPVVVKVDDTLSAAAGTGARLVGETKQRFFSADKMDDDAFLLKETREPSSSHSSRSPQFSPGLITRSICAAERAVKWVLPLKGDERHTEADDNVEDDAPLLQRTVNLWADIYHRSSVHLEVKYITAKVKLNVWYDLHLKPPVDAGWAKTLVVRNYVLRKGRALTDRIWAIWTWMYSQTNKMWDIAVNSVKTAKDICDDSYARTSVTACAFRDFVKLRFVNLKEAISTQTRSCFQRMKLLLKPMTDRLVAVLKPLMDRIAAALKSLSERAKAKKVALEAKKAAFMGKARATYESVEEYVAAKYDQAKPWTRPMHPKKTC